MQTRVRRKHLKWYLHSSLINYAQGESDEKDK